MAERITKRFIMHNAEYVLESGFRQWKIYAWRDLALVVVSGDWDPNNYGYYFKEFWNVFYERRESWGLVHFIVDTNKMPIQTEEFGGYVRDNWIHLLDRNDLRICLVESSAVKRLLWTSIYHLIGKEKRITISNSYGQAFSWFQTTCVSSEA
jgi:hypothetical protein